VPVRGRLNGSVLDPGDDDYWAYPEPEEIPCPRCYATGEDDDGADCVFCEGMGSTLSPVLRL
jgi:hypothetical protein